MPSCQVLVSTPRNPSAGALRCPRCQGELLCEQRRIVDRLHSLFQPVKRYRCNNFRCQWIGNLPRRRGQDTGDDVSDRPGYAAGKRSRRGVPTAFVVHMALVAVGVVFVFVFSSMEQASWVVENAKAFESTFLTAPDPVIQTVGRR